MGLIEVSTLPGQKKTLAGFGTTFYLNLQVN
jgi:hypothetical protein